MKLLQYFTIDQENEKFIYYSSNKDHKHPRHLPIKIIKHTNSKKHKLNLRKVLHEANSTNNFNFFQQ